MILVASISLKSNLKCVMIDVLIYIVSLEYIESISMLNISGKLNISVDRSEMSPMKCTHQQNLVELARAGQYWTVL